MDKIMNNVAVDAEVKEIIKRNLLYLRTTNKLSHEDLAKVINMSRQAYSSYENGTREMSIATLKVLATFYDISLDMLTSYSFSDIAPVTVNFPTLALHQDEYKFIEPSSVSNISASLIAVKLNNLTVLIFESNINHVPDSIQLFEFKEKIHIGKIHFDNTGGGAFKENEKVTFFSKNESAKLVFMGILLANIKKEYDRRNFF